MMTAKESEALRDLQTEIRTMSEKLFGNGTRIGCIDERLESVELIIKTVLPKIVTKEECLKRHETKWSHTVLIIGLAATWVGLVLRAMEVL